MCEESCGCSGEQPTAGQLIISAVTEDMKVEIHTSEECTAEQLVEEFKRIYIALGYSPATIDEYFN